MKHLTGEFFHVDRWIASTAFALPIEPRGLYREMLSRAWLAGAKLPNDHEAIQRLIGASAAEWRRCWPLVARFWRVDSDGYLVNAVQQEIYAASLARSARARHGGATRGALKLARG